MILVYLVSITFQVKCKDSMFRIKNRVHIFTARKLHSRTVYSKFGSFQKSDNVLEMSSKLCSS